MELEDEEAWLRRGVVRLRMLWRYAKDPVVVAGLREHIAEVERRLEALENRRFRPLDSEDAPGG
jgi:hypothetical protein